MSGPNTLSYREKNLWMKTQTLIVPHDCVHCVRLGFLQQPLASAYCLSVAVPWKEKPNKGGRRNEWMSMCMVEGRRVVRGPDWPEECVEDGHKPGTVLGYDHISATVEWDVGGVGRYDMGLKQGNKKIYKLRLLPRGDLYQVGCRVNTNIASRLE